MKFINGILAICLLSCASVFAQIKGEVLNANNQAIPFVSIIHNSKCLAQTDIDGKFSIASNQSLSLEFHSLGYQSRTLNLSPGFQIVQLTESTIQINEVEVKAGENPADTIMRKVIERRNENKPEALSSFSYISYNKFIAFVQAHETMADSSRKKLDSLFSNKDLFLAESVTQRKYLKPDLDNETVIANKVSGIKNTGYSLLASQFQSFSFYQNLVQVMGKKYFSPIHKNALNYYFFYLEEVIEDSTGRKYIISFKPRQGKSFSALKGVLSISETEYALHNIKAETVDSTGTSIKIVQLYQRFDQAWFPVQLQTNISFSNVEVDGARVLAEAKTYLDSIQLGIEIPKKSFSTISIENKVNNKQNLDLLKQYRKETFTDRNAETYVFMDSIGDEANIDQKLLLFQSLSTGKVPIGPIALDINRLYDVNEYEGSRLGLGIGNSYKLLKNWDISGYWAYGFRDKQQKYGGNVAYISDDKAQFKIGLSYKKDIEEQNQRFFQFYKPQSVEKLRNINRAFFNYGDYYSAFLGRRIGYNTFQFQYQYQDFLGDSYQSTQSNKAYQNQFASLHWRFSYREKLAFQQGKILSIENPYPVLNVRLDKSLDALGLGNTLDHWAILARMDVLNKELFSRKFDFAIQYNLLETADSNLVLYHSPLSNSANLFGIQSSKVFESIPMHTFISKHLLSLYSSYTLINYLWLKPKSSPSIVMHYNLAYSDQWLKNNGANDFVAIPSIALHELGLSIPAIYKMKAIVFNQELGLGMFSFLNTVDKNSASSVWKSIQWKLNYRLSF
jgi:hypothetical protein